MYRIRRIFALVLMLVAIPLVLAAQSAQEAYIKKYSALAVEEMHRSGIPASITLAQGMLESGNGKSTLAVKANNHFGIKCHNDWKGEKVYHDDDRKGECFRKYTHPEHSYRDHSDFLRYRERYRFLFDLQKGDYKGWAYGLKKAGYATDPAYPTKLIKLIEDYRLYEYDKKSSSTRHTGIQVSPSVLEKPEVIRGTAQKHYFNVSFSRELYSQNGVPFIYALEGETYESIAKAYGLFLGEVLRFNDLKSVQDILPGTKVYLQSKKNHTKKGLDKHVIDEGETLWGISQKYGVKLKKIYALNGLDKSYVPREGDIIKLRK